MSNIAIGAYTGRGDLERLSQALAQGFGRYNRRIKIVVIDIKI